MNKKVNTKDIEQANKLLPDDEVLAIVIQGFKALAEPSRAKILYAIRKKSLCVSEIANIAGISESATSHQLAYLKEKHLVESKRYGTNIYYRVSYQHLDNLLAEAEEYADHVKNKIPDHPNEEK